MGTRVIAFPVWRRTPNRELSDPHVAPTLVGDFFREPGETFAQAWKSHIESTLDPHVSGNDQDPTAVY